MASVPFPLTFLEQNLFLLPEKAIYWEEQQTLIVADIHLGKVGHFRKAGIAIPKKMEQDDLAELSDLVYRYSPKTILLLGDLFHSDLNNDWDWLVLWRSLFSDLRMILVLGNHDILNKTLYSDLKFELYSYFDAGPFRFSHEPLEKSLLAKLGLYVICGHIHPGVVLEGAGRQMITLSCFHFGKKQAILPAFGKFTGKVRMKNSKEDRIFAVLKDRIVSF
jgi:DNA ligase-associated metallophosphoesterase